MNNIGRLRFAAVFLIWSPAAVLAQAQQTITPDLARLADGRGDQIFNRSLAVAAEGGRAVARLDARAGDGGALIEESSSERASSRST